jgi:hypothetical protein
MVYTNGISQTKNILMLILLWDVYNYKAVSCAANLSKELAALLVNE